MTEPSSNLERARWLTGMVGVLLLGGSIAVCLTHWVTMVTLHVDSDRLEFGFPLPAFRFGMSSGTWTAEAIPLMIDFLFAAAVAVPAAALATIPLRRRMVLVVGVGAVLATVVVHADPLVLLALGEHHLVWRAPQRSPVVCRALWIGPPQSWLHNSDPENPCIERRGQ